MKDSTLSNTEHTEDYDAVHEIDLFSPPPIIKAKAIKIAHSLVKTSLTKLCKVKSAYKLTGLSGRSLSQLCNTARSKHVKYCSHVKHTCEMKLPQDLVCFTCM